MAVLTPMSKLLFGLTVFLCACLSSGADARAIAAAGRIVSVVPAGIVLVAHRDGTRQVARAPLLLRPGDEFLFRGKAVVRAVVHSNERVYTERSKDRRVPDRPMGLFSSLDAAVLDPLSQWLADVRWSIPMSPMVRGLPTSQEVAVSPLLPSGEQFLAPGTKMVALVWSGTAASLEASTPEAGTIKRLDRGDAAWAVFALPSGTTRLRIRTADGALSWDFTLADAAPAPPWWQDSIAAPSEAQRLARAVWILKGGSPKWRSFALTELASLSSEGNFVARELWQGARSGELAALLDETAN